MYHFLTIASVFQIWFGTVLTFAGMISAGAICIGFGVLSLGLAAFAYLLKQPDPE